MGRSWVSRRAGPMGLALVVASAIVHAACSSTSSPATDADAGADAEPPFDAGPGPVDAGPKPITCDTDRAADGMWQHLRCTGLYADFATKTVASDVTEYKPALELWSDGAEKTRWLRLPPGTTIDTSNVDEWVFPAGTKAWKEFRVDGKRVETRLYEKGADGAWRHAAFVWNADESEAAREDGGVKVARGGADVPPYEVPTANQCNDCHGGRADKLLGVEAVNLGMAGAEGITLASLADGGLLSSPPPSTAVAFPEDATGKAAAALGWLHVSCGPCHNRSSAANGEKSRVYTLAHASELLGLDGGAATVTSLDAYASTVGVHTSVEIPDGGGATFDVIKAGDPGSSLASYLSGRRVPAGASPNEKEQMPPIVTRLVDTNGHAKLDAWIAALPP